MLRVSAPRAKPGMILGRAVYDSRGQEVMVEGTKLTEENIGLLVRAGVSEILTKDPRVADVPVGSLFSASLEAKAVRALHVLLVSKQGTIEGVTSADLTDIQTSMFQMVQRLFPVHSRKYLVPFRLENAAHDLEQK